MQNQENSSPCETCGGTGRIPHHRISLTDGKQKRELANVHVLPKEEWLKLRRQVDVKPWLDKFNQAEGPVDYTEVFLTLAARIQYLEEIVYDSLIQQKGE